MSEPNRTHEATPKRKADFRKRGDIALSRELVGAGALIGAVIAILATAGGAIETLLEFTRNAALATDGRDQAWLTGALVHTFMKGAFPALIGGAVVSILTICVQLGWPPSLKGISFDLSKMNPMSNLGNAFGLKGMAQRTATTFAKMLAIGSVVLLVLEGGIVPHAVEAGELGQIAWAVTKKSLLVVVGAIVALAAVDYIMARRRMTEQMKMTPDEVKREHKDSEGDPMIKMRRRQKAREMAKRRIAVTVPTADVIIVNPTHYAVALRYDESQDRAPIVVAKGIDDVAQRIREIARQNGIPIMARPPLARALHKHVKEGKQVPANLYKAVAEVLAYVYRLRGGRR
ncbi:MAG TPA: flagellar type III secretion system protein FlhB [Kofleriaceae bacterium]